MLIVHIISTEDTEHFSTIYQGIVNDENNIILINPTVHKLKKSIKNENGKIIFIGHGTEYGLLNHRLDGYILDSKMVNLLRGKDIIGIWCNASNFADKYDLTGFFTSMFISNSFELLNSGFKLFDDCDVEIEKQNRLFSERINKLLLSDIPTSEWSKNLNSLLTENEHRFVLYNYEAMYSTE